MFLKNESNFQCGLRTKKEVFTIYPGKAIHVLDADIISINSKLKKITEEEYEAILGNKVKKETSEQKPEEPKKDNEPVSDNLNENNQSLNDENDNESSKNNEEENVPQEEVKNETTIEELPNLESRLEMLKKQWEQASRPKRKEILQKQIKEIQEKIAKLK